MEASLGLRTWALFAVLILLAARVTHTSTGRRLLQAGPQRTLLSGKRVGSLHLAHGPDSLSSRRIGLLCRLSAVTGRPSPTDSSKAGGGAGWLGGEAGAGPAAAAASSADTLLTAPSYRWL